MLAKVVSGGQTGADQAGLRAAKAAGLETGGVAPNGWKTEDGPAPWLGTTFGLIQSMSPHYAARTRANVNEGDGTLVFEADESPGTALTLRECDRQKKPVRVVMLTRDGNGVCASWAAHTPASIAAWIAENDIEVLNCAGHRESVCPGIGTFAEQYLTEVFRTLAAGPRP